MKLLILHSFPASSHFLPLRSKYSQYPALKHPEYISLLSMRGLVLHPYETAGRIMVLCSYILIFKF